MVSTLCPDLPVTDDELAVVIDPSELVTHLLRFLAIE